ncbi:hypothetical protein TWF970_010792 [Orbilia oligospora]|uniref:Uncharacterized protein n=1 Tax=Orbilia oligospora TaxID=2813651 RepID=A0A7C8R6T1_ORBOL|nr:hypothetical protein TWF970_010792 [Orbilia oligospora]
MDPIERQAFFNAFCSASSILIREGEPLAALWKILEDSPSNPSYVPIGIQQCHMLFKLHFSIILSSNPETPIYGQIAQEICAYIKKKFQVEEPVLFDDIRLRGGIKEPLSATDMYLLVNIADATIQVYDMGGVLSQNILNWTQEYLQWCCRLSERSLIGNIPNVTTRTRSPGYTDLRMENNLSDAISVSHSSLSSHSSQFLNRNRLKRFICALCNNQTLSEHSLRQHWKQSHDQDAHFYRYWPEMCNACHGLLPFGVPRERHSEICFGVHGLGNINSQVYSQYRWLFYELLGSCMKWKWDLVDGLSDTIRYIIRGKDAQPAPNRRDILQASVFFRRMCTGQSRETYIYDNVHRIIDAYMCEFYPDEPTIDTCSPKEPFETWSTLPELVGSLVAQKRILPLHGKVWFSQYVVTCYMLLCQGFFLAGAQGGAQGGAQDRNLKPQLELGTTGLAVPNPHRSSPVGTTKSWEVAGKVTKNRPLQALSQSDSKQDREF